MRTDAETLGYTLGFLTVAYTICVYVYIYTVAASTKHSSRGRGEESACVWEYAIKCMCVRASA